LEQGTPHPASPQAVPPAMPCPPWATSPPGLPMVLPHSVSFGAATPLPQIMSPMALTAASVALPPAAASPSNRTSAGRVSLGACGASTPAASRASDLRSQVSTPHYCLSPSGLSGQSPKAAAGQRVVLSMPSSYKDSTSGGGALSTPSKLVTISTPLRPCSRQKAKEMQDDIKTAVDEQSVPLLRVALQRRHACPGEHALHEAVRQAHVGAVRLLLQGQAEPNARCLCCERGCEFPLQLAVCSTNFLRGSDRCQAVEMLLRAGARPGPRRGDAEANTPLHDAARRGDLDVARLLLRHGADPNAANGFGEGPLQLALRPVGGDFAPVATAREMAEVLLKAGANPLALVAACAAMPLGSLPPGSEAPLGCVCATAAAADPELRETQLLLARWSAWWRCRHLAWLRSRGSGHPLCQLVPELLVQVAKFL